MALILLIDDDDGLRNYLQAELEGQGHAVQGLDRAKDGPVALSREPFDLVLLDNRMPGGMSGIEFLEALQERGLEVPVILMTGHATADTAIRAMNLGAFDYVIKPDDWQVLFRKLEDLIAKALEIYRPAKEVLLSPEAPQDATVEHFLVGKHPKMVEVYKSIGRFARSDNAVLIRGETGTGKELVARAIHRYSPRKNKRFVVLDCSTIPENLLESELFGHEKGAFTGADKLRKGKFEYADGGTIFLDEIGEMPLGLQAKLLRVLEYQEVARVGRDEPIKVNVRLLSATNRDLEAAKAAGKFRSDLFYRLNRVTLHLPPLAQRLDDLPELAAYFLARAADNLGQGRPKLAESALQRLREHDWPGNARELQNVMYRACSACRGPVVLPEHLDLPGEGPAPAAEGSEDEAIAALRKAVAWGWKQYGEEVWPHLHDLLERELLAFSLARLGGNQREVADRLGMARGTVGKRLKQYGLKKE